MTDYSELKRLAEGATIGDKPANFPIRDLVSALSAFRAECRPTVFLALIAENEALSHWRDLALQFDNHRMAALWHLKRLVTDPQSQSCAELFLREPPMAAHEVVSERDQLKAEIDRLNAELDKVIEFQPIGEACLTNRDTLRASLGLKLGENLHEHVEALRKDAERFEFITRDAPSAMSNIYGDDWLAVIDGHIAVSKEEQS